MQNKFFFPFGGALKFDFVGTHPSFTLLFEVFVEFSYAAVAILELKKSYTSLVSSK